MWRVKSEKDGIIQQNFNKLKAQMPSAFSDLCEVEFKILEKGWTGFIVNLDQSIVKNQKTVKQHSHLHRGKNFKLDSSWII